MADNEKRLRVLIIGATGLVGRSLRSEWSKASDIEPFGTFHARREPGLEALDVMDPSAVGAMLDRLRPDSVVMTASNPHVDYCETHPAETRTINVDAVLSVAKTARQMGMTFAFFSSDYVYDGTRAPYVESVPPSPLNEYGRQKVDAERGVASMAKDHLVFRISGAFGWDPARKNFVLQLLDRAAAGQPIRAAKDVVYHPTYAPNLAPVIAALLRSKERGIFHLTGRDEFSRYDFAVAVAKTFGFDPGLIEPVAAASLHAPAKRPPHSSLVSERLSAELRNQLWDGAKALEHMRLHPEPAVKTLR